MLSSSLENHCGSAPGALTFKAQFQARSLLSSHPTTGIPAIPGAWSWSCMSPPADSGPTVCAIYHQQEDGKRAWNPGTHMHLYGIRTDDLRGRVLSIYSGPPGWSPARGAERTPAQKISLVARCTDAGRTEVEGTRSTGAAGCIVTRSIISESYMSWR